MTDPYIRVLESIEKKIDRSDDVLAKLSDTMTAVSVTLAELKESNRTMQKQQQQQKETDEAQDKEIARIKEKLHTIDKTFIPLDPMPDSLDRNWDVTREVKQRTETIETRLDRAESRIDSVEDKVGTLSQNQSIDDQKWGIVGSVGKWLVNKALIPIIGLVGAGISAAFFYLKVGG